MGEARPDVPMTANSIMLWLSAGKPIGAAAIMQLREQGLVELDDPVGKYIPEFASNGKDKITIAELLMHTGGFRWVDLGPELAWKEIIARICRAPLERGWVPGQRAGYHPVTSWYILGEIVRRVDGRPFEHYVREQIFRPLGMNDSWIGMPRERYLAYGDRLGVMLHLDKPTPSEHRFDSPAGAGACVPGGNAHGPMHDLARFYQMLLGGGQGAGARVLSPSSVELLSTPQRIGMFDETFKHVMDWSLGLILDSNRYGVDTVPYGFGKYSSPRTFGHGGSQSSVGFADPERKLVVAAVFAGMPGEQKHDARIRSFLAALYEDVVIR
jgi:CubicO group peptidase (beta-lactamase class C family)